MNLLTMSNTTRKPDREEVQMQQVIRTHGKAVVRDTLDLKGKNRILLLPHPTPLSRTSAVLLLRSNHNLCDRHPETVCLKSHPFSHIINHLGRLKCHRHHIAGIAHDCNRQSQSIQDLTRSLLGTLMALTLVPFQNTAHLQQRHLARCRP